MYRLWIETRLCKGFANCQKCEAALPGFTKTIEGVFISKSNPAVVERVAKAKFTQDQCPVDAIRFREA